jgi:hypothetical protein
MLPEPRRSQETHTQPHGRVSVSATMEPHHHPPSHHIILLTVVMGLKLRLQPTPVTHKTQPGPDCLGSVKCHNNSHGNSDNQIQQQVRGNKKYAQTQTQTQPTPILPQLPQQTQTRPIPTIPILPQRPSTTWTQLLRHHELIPHRSSPHNHM